MAMTLPPQLPQNKQVNWHLSGNTTNSLRVPANTRYAITTYTGAEAERS